MTDETINQVLLDNGIMDWVIDIDADDALRTCPACGEKIPVSCDGCWSCGKYLNTRLQRIYDDRKEKQE